MLAALLVDLGVDGQTALAELPLNPTANDATFAADFPYFAAPHE
jgi:hypothetical protein